MRAVALSAAETILVVLGTNKDAAPRKVVSRVPTLTYEPAHACAAQHAAHHVQERGGGPQLTGNHLRLVCVRADDGNPLDCCPLGRGEWQAQVGPGPRQVACSRMWTGFRVSKP